MRVPRFRVGAAAVMLSTLACTSSVEPIDELREYTLVGAEARLPLTWTLADGCTVTVRGGWLSLHHRLGARGGAALSLDAPRVCAGVEEPGSLRFYQGEFSSAAPAALRFSFPESLVFPATITAEQVVFTLADARWLDTDSVRLEFGRRVEHD